MTNTYILGAFLLCHDIHLSENVFTTIYAEKEPTIQEATRLLHLAAREILQRNFADDYQYDLSAITVKQLS